MASKWNFKHAFVLAAILVFLAVSLGEALATPFTQIHQSFDDFFPGGTVVSGCTGEACGGTNTTFQFGTPDTTNPTPLWEVVEKVFLETPTDNPRCLTPTCTEYTYVVFNHRLTSTTSVPPTPLPGSGIASFDVANNSNGGVMNAPLNWTPTNTGTSWHWETSTPGTDIAPGNNLGCNLPGLPLGFCFSVTLAGHVPVTFNTTFADLGASALPGGHEPQFCTPTDTTCWRVSAPEVVPEPASLLLLGSGLAGLGLWHRRHSHSRRAALVTSTPHPHGAL